MNVLCFDIATGGLTAAIFDQKLAASHIAEIPWNIKVGPDGAAILEMNVFEEAIRRVIPEVKPDAISFSAFMHNSILLGEREPLTPIFTWMDRRGDQGVELIRQSLGSKFHELTGCRYHPMFPVFKVVSFKTPAMRRIATAKSVLIENLTGSWVEDHGSASASGMYDIRRGDWSDEILNILQVNRSMMPPLVERETVVGHVTSEGFNRYGVPAGIPVVAGSGDGFLANLGSGCEDKARIAVTLGTSASVRQVLPNPVLNETAGTFCYRARSDRFLLGCASSNGGNVFDWARSILGPLPTEPNDRRDLPIFIPFLHGERSPEWDASLTASWHGIVSTHTQNDLATAVVDGVVFNLAQYAEIIECASGVNAAQFVLSGNGFLNPLAPQTLASVLNAEVLEPREQGLASLRGAAACAFQGLGLNVQDRVESILADSNVITGMNKEVIGDRYRRYRELRSRGAAT